jgi:hypothetical protein
MEDPVLPGRAHDRPSPSQHAITAGMPVVGDWAQSLQLNLMNILGTNWARHLA